MAGLGLLLGALGTVPTTGADEGSTVAILYNRRVPESRDVALHYASRRAVPTNQIFGLDLPTGEVITRREYRSELERPLLRALERSGLITARSEISPPPSRGAAGDAQVRVVSSTFRYLVVAYGVPVKISPDPSLSEPGTKDLAEPMRRNEAAVDNELALLPQAYQKPRLAGPLVNPAYGSTNAAALDPTHGLLMVSRLDGPDAASARRLVDLALAAEAEGLWGRAYFDTRGLTNTEYQMGDTWLQHGAEVVRSTGFETVVDRQPATFSAAFPMSQIALYAGWYDGAVSGPFARPTVEFMPGAFAYHLHSFSAHVLRTTNQYWAGPLLARGAAATVGYTEEPFLQATLDVGGFFARWVVTGWTYGEAVYASLPAVSWQTTVIGDPLYRPFGRPNPGDPIGRRFEMLHKRLEVERSPLIEWSHLHVVNLNLVGGYPVDELLGYLDTQLAARPGPILAEKLGDVLYSQARLQPATAAYTRALPLATSPGQRLRLTLAVAEMNALIQQHAAALDMYDQLLRDFPDYPGRADILERQLRIATRLQKTDRIEQLRGEIRRLTPGTTAP